MTNLRELLSSNIKTYRQALGLSQARLADKVGSATNYIAMIEACKKFPSVQMLERLAAALNVDPPELFSTKPPKKESIRTLHRGILQDIEKIVGERLRKLECDL
jgi:transcriptional regulator with XRE-family HTH domain